MADLIFRMNVAATAAWGIAMIVTIVAGYAAVVASKHGFGTEFDLLKCFFWGLGGQVAGQQLSQLTPASITSTLGIKAPST
jgi:hypothetical protein